MLSPACIPTTSWSGLLPCPSARVHCILVVLYTLYAYCVLWWHFKHYLIVRQHYLVKGDDPNYWMALTQQAETQQVRRRRLAGGPWACSLLHVA